MDLERQASPSPPGNGRIPVRTFLLITSAILLLLICGTFNRNEVWRSEKLLWADASEKSPFKLRPRINLALAYQREGDSFNAIREYDGALRLSFNSKYAGSPDALRARQLIAINLGQLRMRQMDFEGALQVMSSAWNEHPGSPSLAINLGYAFVEIGRPDIAVKVFEVGAANLHIDHPELREYPVIDPDAGALYHNLALSYKLLGQCSSAVEASRTAHHIWRDYPIIECPDRPVPSKSIH